MKKVIVVSSFVFFLFFAFNSNAQKQVIHYADKVEDVERDLNDLNFYNHLKTMKYGEYILYSLVTDQHFSATGIG
jgi:hypothetical protein